jgi:hypothetical protein
MQEGGLFPSIDRGGPAQHPKGLAMLIQDSDLRREWVLGIRELCWLGEEFRAVAPTGQPGASFRHEDLKGLRSAPERNTHGEM